MKFTGSKQSGSTPSLKSRTPRSAASGVRALLTTTPAVLVRSSDLVLLRKFMSLQLTEVRREKIDFRKIAEESGASLGNLCHSPVFGWGVRTQGGYPADFCSITPPPFRDGESELRIEGCDWVFFSALENARDKPRHE